MLGVMPDYIVIRQVVLIDGLHRLTERSQRLRVVADHGRAGRPAGGRSQACTCGPGIVGPVVGAPAVGDRTATTSSSSASTATRAGGAEGRYFAADRRGADRLPVVAFIIHARAVASLTGA